MLPHLYDDEMGGSKVEEGEKGGEGEHKQRNMKGQGKGRAFYFFTLALIDTSAIKLAMFKIDKKRPRHRL